jgi:hypothetical protein
MTPAPATSMENNEQPAEKSRRASKTRALKPASAIRNRMKDDRGDEQV